MPYLLSELCANMRLPGQNENKTRVNNVGLGDYAGGMRPEVLRLRGSRLGKPWPLVGTAAATVLSANS